MHTNTLNTLKCGMQSGMEFGEVREKNIFYIDLSFSSLESLFLLPFRAVGAEWQIR